MSDSTFWGGKHAYIAGGSAGLGLALANACARRGMRVTLVARDHVRLEEAAESLRQGGAEVATIAADLEGAGEPRRAFEEASTHTPVDVACHLAGLSARGRVVNTTRAAYEKLFAINFLAAAELASAAAESVAERRGSLVLVGSLASHVAAPFMGAYPASKHALSALAQQLRLEWGEAGLHTLHVCPGPMARDDAGHRYDEQAVDLPEAARRPGGGADVKLIDPAGLADEVLAACEHRRAELVRPKKARLLFALSKLSPAWGDWLLKKKMG